MMFSCLAVRAGVHPAKLLNLLESRNLRALHLILPTGGWIVPESAVAVGRFVVGL
jgi:hypothetical protein